MRSVKPTCNGSHTCSVCYMSMAGHMTSVNSMFHIKGDTWSNAFSDTRSSTLYDLELQDFLCMPIQLIYKTFEIRETSESLKTTQEGWYKLSAIEFNNLKRPGTREEQEWSKRALSLPLSLFFFFFCERARLLTITEVNKYITSFLLEPHKSFGHRHIFLSVFVCLCFVLFF